MQYQSLFALPFWYIPCFDLKAWLTAVVDSIIVTVNKVEDFRAAIYEYFPKCYGCFLSLFFIWCQNVSFQMQVFSKHVLGFIIKSWSQTGISGNLEPAKWGQCCFLVLTYLKCDVNSREMSFLTKMSWMLLKAFYRATINQWYTEAAWPWRSLVCLELTLSRLLAKNVS